MNNRNNFGSSTGNSLFATGCTQAKANLRREKDVHKLMVSEYNVQVVGEGVNAEMLVAFKGPKDSPYEKVSMNLSNSLNFL